MKTRTRTQTVVFTDMADYTRTVAGTDREGLRNLLALHEERVGPILRGRGGRIVKNIGDSFMALFDSATDAVRACLDLVEANPPGSAASFRASASTGDVEETDAANGLGKDAFGEPCNMAARIIARAAVGEVWFSPSTLLCMNQAEIPWEGVGRFALKGLVGEIEVYRAVPSFAANLPEALGRAVAQNLVVVWKLGDPAPPIPAGAHAILDGFRPGSAYLTKALESLPIVDPSRIWLSTYNISPLDRFEWTRSGRGLIVTTPTALHAQLDKLKKPARRVGSDTLILDVEPAAVELVMAGLALPMVGGGPMADIVAGYSFCLGPDGRWLGTVDRALLRVEVEGPNATLTALSAGILVDGRVVGLGDVSLLVEGTSVKVGDLTFRYRSLGTEGYIGVLVGDSSQTMGIVPAQTIELGREPNHPGFLLPARNSQDNIRWCNGPRATRAREKGFTLDNVLTGRRQAQVMAAEDCTLSAVSIHETCPSFVLKPQKPLQRLWSGSSPVAPDDLLIMGVTVIAIRSSGD